MSLGVGGVGGAMGCCWWWRRRLLCTNPALCHAGGPFSTGKPPFTWTASAKSPLSCASLTAIRRSATPPSLTRGLDGRLPAAVNGVSLKPSSILDPHLALGSILLPRVNHPSQAGAPPDLPPARETPCTKTRLFANLKKPWRLLGRPNLALDRKQG